jgi:hypothetical protein
MPEPVALKPGLFQSMAMGGTAAAFAVNFTVRELKFYIHVTTFERRATESEIY